jgi:predicted unusual protein kinase regulating ubiquinone biosynthesis (AarF/ABC1/UbiB family)
MLGPSERLIRLRKVLGLSQREMAEEFQVSSGAIGSWEIGDREIPGPVLKLIDYYESELLPKSLTDESNETLSTAGQLTQLLAVSTKVTDKEILNQMREAFSIYAHENLGTTDLARKLRGMALKRLVRTLGETRGLPMKVAQIATFLDPRIPREVREAFESLQSQARAMSYKVLCLIFLDEFGRTPDELFQEFSRKPIASASIGQVHRARLHDGTWVAVKVQHPEVQEKIESNFHELEFVNQLALFLGGDAQEMRNLLGDLQATVMSECDFLQEAENQEKFRELFSSNMDIVIPKIVFSHSRKQVLTMEWIEGRSWAQFRETADQGERDRAAKIISDFYAQSCFKHCLIHADPHPGNYIFPDGKVAILDFGRVKKLAPNIKNQLHKFHELLMNEDRAGAEIFMKTTDLFLLRSTFDFDRFWQIATRISRHLQQDIKVPFSNNLLVEHRALLKELGQGGAIHASTDFFWAILFTHTLLISGRVDLGASANWREILVHNM